MYCNSKRPPQQFGFDIILQETETPEEVENLRHGVCAQHGCQSWNWLVELSGIPLFNRSLVLSKMDYEDCGKSGLAEAFAPKKQGNGKEEGRRKDATVNWGPANSSSRVGL